MSDESILAAMRHCRDVLATNGFETDAVTLNNAIRALKRAESTALRPGDRLPGGENMVMPVEPTEAMIVAGCHHENMGDMAGRYKAMLAVIRKAS